MDGIIAQMDGSPEKDALRSTWHCLSENEQYLLTQAYAEGRPFCELAQEQGCTPAALRDRLMRARAKARAYMNAQIPSALPQEP